MSIIQKATVLLVGVGVVLALGGAPAHAAYNPVTICNAQHGGGFTEIDHVNMAAQGAGGTVYLMFNGTYNCVVTIKTKNVGTPTPTSAQIRYYDNGPLHQDGGTTEKYSYYAGPVYTVAPIVCVQWGGAVADNSELGSHQDSYTSPWEHGTCSRGASVANRALDEYYSSTHKNEDPLGSDCNYYTNKRPGHGGYKCNSDGWYAERWCADFVYYVYDRSNKIDLTGITGLAASLKSYGGVYHSRSSSYTPAPGDAIVFDWNSDGVIDHVGIVFKYSGSTITTVEGNTAQNNVGKKTYSRNDSDIVGFTTPDWV